MTRRAGLAIALAGVLAGAAACASGQRSGSATSAPRPDSGRHELAKALDDILSAPALTRALVGVRIESLTSGLLYQRNSDKLVVPASNMKLLTLAVAAERLGWDHQFETRLEAVGTIADGVLTGDLVVTGSGDPSIVAPDLGHPALFLEWADALQTAGIRRVDGRILGDDNAFDDAGIGPGWAWDYLSDGYAAPSGALSYNLNTVAVRVTPGRAEGGFAAIELFPSGSGLSVNHAVSTGPRDSRSALTVGRAIGSREVMVGGSLPAGGAPVARTITIDNPTRYFVGALEIALVSRGITVRDGAWDIDEVTRPPRPAPRRLVATRMSVPLSALAAVLMKDSQNFYAEMLLKAVGRRDDRPGSTPAGRLVAREVLGAWGIDAGSFVMHDGSGLSRYDYVTSDAIVALLKHVWNDDRLRGPFVAALPIGAHDGTLENRMKNTALDRRVQAKTGTIANVRSLSGFLETQSGERIVFSIIANHFTVSSAQIDAVAEDVLMRLVTR